MAPAKKTVLRSIRITEDLDETLRTDAEAQGTSVNALLARILRGYAEWDRFADRFGFVTITRTGYRAMLDAIEEAKLPDLGAQLGAQNPREMTLFWFKKLNADTLLAYLTLLSKHAKTMQHDVSLDGRMVTVTFQLDSPKQAKFMGSFVEQAIRTVAGVTPRIEVGKNSVVARFSRP